MCGAAQGRQRLRLESFGDGMKLGAKVVKLVQEIRAQSRSNLSSSAVETSRLVPLVGATEPMSDWREPVWPFSIPVH